MDIKQTLSSLYDSFSGYVHSVHMCRSGQRGVTLSCRRLGWVSLWVFVSERKREEVSGLRYEEKRRRLWSEALDFVSVRWSGKGGRRLHWERRCHPSKSVTLAESKVRTVEVDREVRCLPRESMWSLSTTRTTHHRFVGVKKCGARSHDPPQREAIVSQQAPPFSNYDQDQLMSITRGILSHHKMPLAMPVRGPGSLITRHLANELANNEMRIIRLESFFFYFFTRVQCLKG